MDLTHNPFRFGGDLGADELVDWLCGSLTKRRTFVVGPPLKRHAARCATWRHRAARTGTRR